MVLKFNAAPRFPEGTEGMQVGIARAVPIPELDPELKGGARRLHEARLLHADQFIEHLEVRQRGLAHADRTDLVRFDQRDCVVLAWQARGERGGRHPPGGATAEDRDREAFRHLEPGTDGQLQGAVVTRWRTRGSPASASTRARLELRT